MAKDWPRKSEETLGFVVNDVARLIRKLFEQKAKGSGLTRAQWQVLAHLSKRDGIRQGALAEILELEPISLSRVVDKLEAAGLVERRPDEFDRRSKRLFLLEPARPALEQMMVIAEECRAEALKGIPAEEVKAAMETLSKMRLNLARDCTPEAGGRCGADGAQGHAPQIPNTETVDG